MKPVTTPPYIPPVHEVLRDKRDPLDWETLPLGACDLNYRPETGHPAGIGRFAVGLFLIVTALSLLLGSVLRTFAAPALNSVWFFIVSLIAGGLFALQRLTKQELQSEGESRVFLNDTVLVLFLPAFLWVVTILSPFAANPEGAFLLFVIFAVPVCVWVSDGITSHAVFWMTAHPKIDHETMITWRADWERRFNSIPTREPRRDDLTPEEKELHERVMRERASYLSGLLWLLACLAIPAVLLVFSRGVPTHKAGICLSVSLLGSFLLAGFLRSRNFPRAFPLFVKALGSFLCYGSLRQNPPWVFQSPGGTAARRQLITVLLLFLLAGTVVPLSDYFRWVFLGELNAGHLPREVLQAVSEGGAGQVGPQVKAIGRGHGYTAVCLLAEWLLCLTVPALVLLLIGFLLSGPVIAAHHAALEAPNAYEQHPDWTPFDGHTERLRNSRNAIERSSQLIATHPAYDYPVLMHTDLYFEHLHILGSTGSGKTSLGLIPHLVQVIRRGDGAVLVIDGKGDPALFHTVETETRRSGRKFKWFTNRAKRSTYVFNPIDETILGNFTLAEVIGFLTAALNLHHGDDYGRAWFSIASRILMKRSIEGTLPEKHQPGRGRRSLRRGLLRKLGRIESFRDLNEVILFLAQDGREFQAAQHLAFLVESLADFEQLNLAPNREPDHRALHHAIRMPEVIREKQVVYFYLVGAMDIASVAEIARLATYSLLSACIAHKDETGATPRTYAFFDEAQTVIAQNIQNVLAQARSHGMACILAHQTMSQLNPPGGVDLRELVMSCTSVKQIFSARDPWLQKYLSDGSGRVRYGTLSYNQYPEDLTEGYLGPLYAAPDDDGYARVRVTETPGPRLTPQDILDVNRNDNLCILGIERAKGFSRFHGFSPVYIDYPITEPEYRRRSNASWPPEDEGTIVIPPDWPKPNGETIIPTSHPPLLPSPGGTTERLRELKRRLEED